MNIKMYKTLVYWYGIIGIPGKGPHYIEPYDPNRTMTSNGSVERNKRVVIYYRDLNLIL
jgi:hypothetical protein